MSKYNYLAIQRVSKTLRTNLCNTQRFIALLLNKMDDISIRTSKKRRRRSDGTAVTDESPLDLLTLYQSDVGSRILSFASGADLCTLDILNKQFNTLTTDQWKVVTNDRFGMSDGKEGWKIGTSFLRTPVFIHNTSNYEEDDVGDPHVAANESMIVTVTNNDDRNQSKELELEMQQI